ncbi:type II toxin-antitoxin system ParD family antitoxin [Sphingomonas colocasiae]|uniref:Type II toxin-antitoxin system ParD family antitoxin n=1 Tax=Sphingomonas colocasiae TaxID=1848973 RepID=A0ABS7PZ31_9SPHN|nr:type II toxin-antitoxin system ParD family antitoxin [Sphingomonas colocasiae]MBY8823323.1 type II toxin-antitoxin system ParD family antitoxin [Sphingomonas colocasiae]MBY8826458.1 type II toxin-antitoxin system ParD family antitoxin [Sphingomonas colocasiae]
MPPRNVVLTDRQSQSIDRLVKSGHYQNASEVLRDGLRLVEHDAAENAARLEALRTAAQAGWNDVEAGRFVDVAEDALDGFISGLGRQAGDRATVR